MYFSEQVDANEEPSSPQSAKSDVSSEVVEGISKKYALTYVVAAAKHGDNAVQELNEGFLSEHEDLGLPDDALESLGSLGDTLALLNLGSALHAGDVSEVARLSGNNAIGPILHHAGLQASVGAFVQSTWFALHYPVWGSVLSWGPLASIFGPPAFLVDVATGGVALAIALPLKRITSGLHDRWERNSEAMLTQTALPVVYATATVDGEFSIEELRYLKDLLGQFPAESGVDIVEEINHLQMSDRPREDALAAIYGAKQGLLGKLSVGAEAVLRFAVTASHADGDFDDQERDFLVRIGKALGLDKDEARRQIDELDTTYRREQFVAKAALRAMYDVAQHVQTDDAQFLLDAFLVAQVPAESDRQTLVEELIDSSEPAHLTRAEICQGEPLYDNSSLGKTLNPWSEERPYQEDLKFILEATCDFAYTLKEISTSDLDNEFSGVEKFLETLASEYAVSTSDLKTLRENVRTRQEDAKKVLEHTETSTCPECGSDESFSLTAERWIGRNEYECGECSKSLMFCQFRSCENFVLAGDFYHEQFCEEHWFGGDEESDDN